MTGVRAGMLVLFCFMIGWWGVVSSSCGILQNDYYECGTANSNGAVRLCDGPGEICLCGITPHRCAVAKGRCDSGYAFRFPTEGEDSADGGADCVPPGKVEPKVTPDAPRKFCAGEGELPIVCGGPNGTGGYVPCPKDTFCYCPTRTCVQLDPGCRTQEGEVGLRTVYGSVSTCVSVSRSDASGYQQLFAQPEDNACPGFRPTDAFPWLDAGAPKG